MRSAIDSARPDAGAAQWARLAGGNWGSSAARRRAVPVTGAAAAAVAVADADADAESPVLSPPRGLSSPSAGDARCDGWHNDGDGAAGASAGVAVQRLQSIAGRVSNPATSSRRPRYTLEDVLPPAEGTSARERLEETLPAASRPALAAAWRERAAQAALLRARSRRAQHWLSRENAMLRCLLAGRSADAQLQQWREARSRFGARAQRLCAALEDAADAVASHCRELGSGSDAAVAAAAAHADMECAVDALPVLAPAGHGPAQDRVGDMLAPAAHARSVMRRLRRQVQRAARRPPPRVARGTVAAGVRFGADESRRRTAWDRKQGELESRWRARCGSMVRRRPPASCQS